MLIPTNMTFNNWANSLVIDFPNSFIPIPPKETDWKRWARIVCEQNDFSVSGTLNPNSFKTWKDWAILLYKQLN